MFLVAGYTQSIRSNSVPSVPWTSVLQVHPIEGSGERRRGMVHVHGFEIISIVND